MTTQEIIELSLSTESPVECYLVLAGGIAKSSKTLTADSDGTLDIFHSISDCWETITFEEFKTSYGKDCIWHLYG